VDSNLEYNDEESRKTEIAYLSPEIVGQRQKTLEIINPQAGELVIDAGCGPGLLAADLANAVGPNGRVVCRDASSPMLELARKRCADLSNVSFQLGDAATLPAEQDSTDIITCIQLLLYVEDVAQILHEFLRVLRPGGRLFVIETDWRSAVVGSNDDALTEKIVAAWDQVVPNARLPARLIPLLKESGFDSIAVHAIPIVSTAHEPDGFSMTMLAQCAATACELDIISQEQRQKWLAELQDRGDRGEFFFSFNRFLFSAAKP
jgi:arsenite methyltransferase